ncbi:hypothetical protein [Pseudobacillus badius]|uniref:hypothetical protein n=1 Tax=Bacillus badius TaxID=1455 RepID=UPI001CBEFADA|nr:hypothetical protein [Bacillus badius]MED0666122.1 hypothetical protein [Bacillus badius]UAT30927.1 hypothetical protein K7T73_01185 [Bacillus badius]GLY11670.1 diaminopimelate epimerase [Bacillus badius]
MKLDFVKASPAQNMTVLITNHPPAARYAAIANTVMSYEYAHAEQVGFLVSPQTADAVLRLEMSGGEFCGNAVLTAAAYCLYKGITVNGCFLLESSGANQPLACEVTKKSSSFFEAKAEMPAPLSVEALTVHADSRAVAGHLVRLDGITHFLTSCWLNEEEFEPVLKQLIGNIDDKAIGIIPYRKLTNEAYEIRPFVYVKETGSQFFERACGSGTLALGVYLGEKRPLTVHQPGGVIYVETGEKNFIATTVRFTCEGVINLEEQP